MLGSFGIQLANRADDQLEDREIIGSGVRRDLALAHGVLCVERIYFEDLSKL